MHYSYIFCALLMFHASWRTVHACPAFCTCKWKNGKQTVNCVDRNLSDIPEGLDPGTQVLDFSGNVLGHLDSQLFSEKKLINLQRIYLSRCKIRTINDRTFRGLTNLVELDLSNNLIETVPSGCFADCPSLMRLTLSSNPIRALKKLAFNHLSFLSTLELTGCELEEIEEGAFHGLHSLEWLYLDENKLKTVRGIATLPENLKGVELRGNMWECDCHIKDFYVWLKNFRVPISVEPTCHGPLRLTGRVIKSIPDSELACLPDASPTTFYLELAEGKNVSLLCRVHAVPEASVSWWFQGQILQNNSVVAPGLHLIYFVEEGSENKRSELYIYNANTEDNGTFVCSAENAAGTSHSNFTIRIIIKEDPVVVIVSFPLEHLLAAAAGAAVLGLVIIIIILVSIVRYRQRIKRRAKRNKAKDATSQCRESARKSLESPDDDDALSSNNLFKTSISEEMTLYNNSCHPGADQLNTMSLNPGAVAVTVPTHQQGQQQQQNSPPLLESYHLEQNPDLINGTESAGSHLVDDRKLPDTNSGVVRQIPPAVCMQTSLEIYGSSIGWGSPAYCVDPEGYPVDYGLPKPANGTARSQPLATGGGENFYRTLPCNRMRRQSSRMAAAAAVTTTRYSQEAELLPRNPRPPLYDHYHANVRYTADGYPVPPSAFQPFHHEILIGPSSLSCCSATPLGDFQWPGATCVTAPINPDLEYNSSNPTPPKRSASAQTDAHHHGEARSEDGTKMDPESHTISSHNNDSAVNEVLTESPDEGYEGEPSVV